MDGKYCDLAVGRTNILFESKVSIFLVIGWSVSLQESITDGENFSQRYLKRFPEHKECRKYEISAIVGEKKSLNLVV